MKTNRQATIRTVLLSLGLLWASPTQARPRPASPPYPEKHLSAWRFDSTNLQSAAWSNLVAVENLELAESWSGYALNMAGAGPRRLAIPAVACGRTNLALRAGAVRLWFAPNWSASATGSDHPADGGRLLEAGAWSGNQAERAWALEVAAGGMGLSLVAGSGENRVQLWSAPILWQSGEWHLVVLNYNAQGSALYLDGELAASGAALPIMEAGSTPGFCVGSGLLGHHLAQGQFDELTTFAEPQAAELIAWNYTAFAPLAALGPITAEEATARRSQMAAHAGRGNLGGTRSLASGLISVPGGWGGSSTNSGDTYTNTCPPAYSAEGLKLFVNGSDGTNLSLTILEAAPNASYDVFFRSAVTGTDRWTYLFRTAAGQTNFTVSLALGTNGFLRLGTLADSDGDTLSDAFETLVSLTSIWSPDSTNTVSPNNPVYEFLIPTQEMVYVESIFTSDAQKTMGNICELSEGTASEGLYDYYCLYTWTNQFGGWQTDWWVDHCCIESNIAYLTNLITTELTNTALLENFGAYCEDSAVYSPDWLGTAFARSERTRLTLFTGGPPLSTNVHLFRLHVTAQERHYNLYDYPLPMAGGPPIAPSQIRLGTNQVDADGNVYLMLGDYQVVDVTPDVPGYTNYTFFVTPTKTTLRISRFGVGDITETLQSGVWVGEKVGLLCWLDPQGVAAPTNFQWAIPGIIVSNFLQVSSPTGWAGAVCRDVPLTNQEAHYYWVDGHNPATVECTATVLGHTLAAKTFFQVQRPEAQLAAEFHGIGVLSPNWLQFGIDSPTNCGIYFEFASPEAAEKFIFLETGEENPRQLRVINGQTNWWAAPGYGLHDDYPFPKRMPQNATWAFPFMGFADDAIELEAYGNYIMYLMFKPATTDSIPVPIQSLGWSWAGVGKFGTNELQGEPYYGWSAAAGGLSKTALIGTNTDQFPMWYDNLWRSRLDYEQEANP